MTERQVAWTTFLNNEPYLYQEHRSFFAQVAHPIEEMAGEELAELGATNVDPQYRGVQFSADAESLRRIVYCARIPTRVMAPLMTFDCHSDKYLYKRACEMDWMSLIGVSRTFAIFATVSHSRITHSKYAALKLKDAIVDTIRNEVGSRPDVDRHDPDVSINLHIDNNRATVSIDVAGRSMHRRGYRLDSLEAPLQETVAAAIIRMSGWKGDVPLLDPMCGSGTLLIEGARIALDVAPGYGREYWGFSGWLGHVPSYWTDLMAEAEQRMQAARARPLPDCFGYDSSLKAIRAAEDNIASAKLDDVIRVRVKELATLTQPTHKSIRPGLVITNPPYGERLGDDVWLVVVSRVDTRRQGWEGVGG